MIEYRTDKKITADEFIEILKRSTLDRRRPVEDRDRIQSMLDHGNVLATAWDADRLVGVSRALSDFSFCCYLSDLAVDQDYQRKGIGKRLIEITHKISGTDTALILLAAPDAAGYYPHIGMERFVDCFLIQRKSK